MQHVFDMRGSETRLTEDQVKQCFQKTFDVVQQLKVEAGIGDEVSNFNMMVTSGRRMFGTRYSSHPERETRTLYYSTGTRFQGSNGVYRMENDSPHVEAVLIASEKLNMNKDEWTVVPENHFISVDRKLNLHLSPMQH
jgi:hypothetical protein